MKIGKEMEEKHSLENNQSIPLKITTLNIFRLFETLGFCSSFINVLIGVLFTLAKSVLEDRQELPLYLFFFCTAKYNILPNKFVSILTSTNLPFLLHATYYNPLFANVQTFCFDNFFSQFMILIACIFGTSSSECLADKSLILPLFG